MINIIDLHSNSIVFDQFLVQLEMVLRDRNYLMQVAFDFFDSNGDGKIT